jgi:hypothetical protein
MLELLVIERIIIKKIIKIKVDEMIILKSGFFYNQSSKGCQVGRKFGTVNFPYFDTDN